MHTESVTATSPESSKAEPADKELSKQSAITEDLNDTIPVEVVKQATNEVKSSKDGGFLMTIWLQLKTSLSKIMI
ncbi:hypothetical protein ACTGVR_00690 [Streptococcus suis]|uniref:hypothetical protein n=1 Tax=Streptococcus suis TaxID=1307 RepID=UPI0005CE9252|nr:hypothetical protein [Streptococcus suis]NQO92040.1 hypothetical protein [Streptococcus suis]NQQ49987.1 hypothetical protein [Streptococcus suis]CYT92943.1 Uncharacterised protein [Streptococcus suis]HEM5473155.1 hypothetical protein [Streptococcus suis]HEM5564658.1 hypothetical protein [Streptococcus suis]